MRNLKILCCSLLLTALTVATSQAAKLPLPEADYSADNLLSSGSQQMPIKVHYSQEKLRQEMTLPGAAGSSVSISRYDLGVIWVLMPDQKMYTETRMTGETADEDWRSAELLEQTELGHETINGEKTTKYRIVANSDDKTNDSALIWLTDDGIMMRMESVVEENGRQETFTQEITRLSRGKQDARLFEPPAGYTKMEMPAFPAGMMGGGMMDEDGMTDGEDAEDAMPSMQEMEKMLQQMQEKMGAQ